MTLTHVAINGLALVTVWLAVVWSAVRLTQLRPAAVQWRVLLLRIGLAGVPAVLAIGLAGPALPWAKPIVRVARPELTSATLEQSRETGQPDAAVQDLPSGPSTSGNLPAAGVRGETPSAGELLILGWALVIAWLAGASIAAARLVLGFARLARQRRDWQPIDDPAIRDLAAQAAHRIGLNRPFRLLACDDSFSPMPVATGIRRPTVVLPRGQLARLATLEGRAVLAHELAHLQNRDPLWRVLGAAAGVLLWFHPLMIWLNRRVEIDSEFQCDQAALAAGADRRGYARLLIGLAEMAWSNRPLAVAAIGAVHRASHLERRLRMILSKTFTRGPGTIRRRTRWLVLAGAIALGGSLSSVALLGEGNDAPAGPRGPAQDAAPLALSPAAGPRQAEPAAEADSTAAPEAGGGAAADRVVVVLLGGQRVDGMWLGSSADCLRLLVGDSERTIPLREVAQIRLLHPELAAAMKTPRDAERFQLGHRPGLTEPHNRFRLPPRKTAS